ncbi:MAG: peptidoglycan recognition family protein [Candidatus Nanopelagicales bacterium]
MPVLLPLLFPVDTEPAVKPPPIVEKYIPYGPKRKKQMARYSKRHYGVKTWHLTDPKVIVLHYTVSTTWQSPWNLFASNTPAGGPSGSRPESPGGCTHFIVHTDGTILQLAPLTTMCRHAIGINSQSVGIEFVEMRSASNILARPKQRKAGVRLVRWLQSELGIAKRNVIGHRMVNNSTYFVEKVRGWRNDHTDWNRKQVRTFRRLL